MYSHDKANELFYICKVLIEDDWGHRIEVGQEYITAYYLEKTQVGFSGWHWGPFTSVFLLNI